MASTDMISYVEARRLIGEATSARPVISAETVCLAQSLGRVCSSDLFGREPIPPFDNSSMDGYALASARALGDSSAPTTLPILGTIFAGDPPRCQTAPGAWRIMTGAPLPAGCDAVVPVEQTRELDGGRTVEILRAPNKGDFIRGAGRDFGAGARVCPSGTRLGPRHLMALAATGMSQVPVRRKPRVALIATGRELAAPGKPLGPGQIRDASTAYLAAECGRLGLHFDCHGVVADDAAAFSARMDRVLESGYDMILTTGAVSMGEADFIPTTLQDLGAETLFHKVAVKPGRPVLFAEFPKGPFVFGLPGNPVSTVVGMRFFVEPCLRHLQGRPDEIPLRCRLKSRVDKPEKLRCFYKARRLHVGSVEVLPAQASFQIHSLLSADCWAVLPEEGNQVEADTEIDVYEA